MSKLHIAFVETRREGNRSLNVPIFVCTWEWLVRAYAWAYKCKHPSKRVWWIYSWDDFGPEWVEDDA